ncbi:hypothetical protein P8610_20465 [Fictibacillus sp. UD]
MECKVRDSCGTSGQVRPLWRKAARGSPPAPRKASTWNGNQLLPKKNSSGSCCFYLYTFNFT